MNTSNNCDISQIGGNIHHTGFCDPIRADNNHHFMGHTASNHHISHQQVVAITSSCYSSSSCSRRSLPRMTCNRYLVCWFLALIISFITFPPVIIFSRLHFVVPILVPVIVGFLLHMLVFPMFMCGQQFGSGFYLFFGSLLTIYNATLGTLLILRRFHVINLPLIDGVSSTGGFVIGALLLLNIPNFLVFGYAMLRIWGGNQNMVFRKECSKNVY